MAVVVVAVVTFFRLLESAADLLDPLPGGLLVARGDGQDVDVVVGGVEHVGTRKATPEEDVMTQVSRYSGAAVCYPVKNL